MQTDSFKFYSERLSPAYELLEKLFACQIIYFSDLVPSLLPDSEGVYAIFDTSDYNCLYVGRTKNLRRRLYTNHLMGPINNARLKKYLIEDTTFPEINSKENAKQYIRDHCYLRYLQIPNMVERGQIEGMLSYLLNVRYIQEEH